MYEVVQILILLKLKMKMKIESFSFAERYFRITFKTDVFDEISFCK